MRFPHVPRLADGFNLLAVGRIWCRKDTAAIGYIIMQVFKAATPQ